MIRRLSLTFATAALLGLSLVAFAAAAKPSLRELANDRASFFGQSGQGATLRPIGHSERYRLTLHRVSTRSKFYREDHGTSLRTHAKVDTGGALRALFGNGRRLAAIEVPGAPASHDSLAANLSSPSYDRAAGTVSYVAEPLAKVPGSGVTPHGLKVDRRLPSKLGAAEVFVGSPHDGLTCRSEAIGEVNGAGEGPPWNTVVGQSKWPTDAWETEPQSETYSESAFLVWSSEGEDDRGCSDTAVVGITEAGETKPRPAPTMTMTTTYEWGNHAHEECTLEKEWGSCSTHTSTHGLFDTTLDVEYKVYPGDEG